LTAILTKAEGPESRPQLDWNVAGIAACLALITFAWFLVDGGLIETGGDAFGRWGDLTALAESGKPIGFSHHSTRWGINLPVLIYLKSVGSTHPLLYHLVMPSFGAGTAVCLYLIIRPPLGNLSGAIGAALLVLAFMVIAPSERPFSQLLPMGAATFYMSLCLLCLKYAFGAKNKTRLFYFFIAGIVCLCAYGTKLTLLWFAIPTSIFVLLSQGIKKDWSSLIAFFAPVILGLLLELILIYQGTGSLLGRALYMISAENSHGRGLQSLGSLPASTDFNGWGFGTFSEYLLNSPMKYFEALGWYSFIIYGGVCHSVFGLVRCRDGSLKNSFESALQWIVVGFFLLQSYAVVHVAPYIFPEKYIHARYQYALLVLSAAYCFYQIVNWQISRSEVAITNGKRSFGIALPAIVLAVSLAFFTNNILSRHNNFGILVTLIHNKVLTEWIDSGGNVGYLGEIAERDEGIDVNESIRRSLNYRAITDYVRALYRRTYCEPSDSFVYRNEENIYALCNPWMPGSSALIYYATSYEFVKPEGLEFLGKYSDLAKLN
jgi:signal transduction histidine kinase